MSALSIQPTYPIFTDIDGQPLEDGYVWIGTANLDPQTNPINVYWDAALTLPAAQPIRTLAGYPANSGTPARLYVNSDYSIRVMDKNGSIIYNAANAAADRFSAAQISFVQAGAGAVPTTAEAKMREQFSVLDFGAVSDGVTDSTAFFQAALDALTPNSTLIVKGDFYLAQNVYLKDVDNVTIDGTGASITLGSNQFITFESCDNVTMRGFANCLWNPVGPSLNRPPSTAVPNVYFGFALIAYVCNNFTLEGNYFDLNNVLPIGLIGCNKCVVTNNIARRGGDNTFYLQVCNQTVVSNNVVTDTNAGRAIAFQRGVGNTITGNTVSGGKGFGISVVGTSATTITGNTVKDVAFDPAVLITRGGISVEGQESADVSPAELVAANADLYLMNGAYSRSISVVGNVIDNCGFGVVLGLGPQGNWGVVQIEGNVITDNDAGIQLVACRGPATIKGNKIRGCQTAGILVQGVFNQTTIDSNDIEQTNLAGFGYTGIHKDVGVSGLLDLVISNNKYLFSGRSNFTYTEVNYILDWPDTPVRSIFRDGDTTIITTEGNIAGPSGSYQALVDLTAYMSTTLSIADVVFQMGQTDRNPIPMAKFTYAQSSNTNYYQTLVVDSFENVRINNGVLEVLAQNAAILGYGGVWRTIITINKAI